MSDHQEAIRKAMSVLAEVAREFLKQFMKALMLIEQAFAGCVTRTQRARVLCPWCTAEYHTSGNTDQCKRCGRPPIVGPPYVVLKWCGILIGTSPVMP